MSFFAPFQGGQSATVGTFFGGDHTIAELKELLTANDYAQKQIEAASLATLPKNDPALAAAWTADWLALKARYGAASAVARASILSNASFFSLPDTVATAEPEWQGILRSLKRNPDTITKGDLQDLYDRLKAMGGVVDESNTPQPSSSSDLELRVFKKLDGATHVIDQAAEAAKEKAKQVAESNTTLLVLGGIVLGGGLILFLRR